MLNFLELSLHFFQSDIHQNYPQKINDKNTEPLQSMGWRKMEIICDKESVC